MTPARTACPLVKWRRVPRSRSFKGMTSLWPVWRVVSDCGIRGRSGAQTGPPLTFMVGLTVFPEMTGFTRGALAFLLPAQTP